MIKTIIFDIGNVLLLFSHEKMILQLSEELDLPFALLKQKILDERFIHDYEAGLISTDQMLNTLLTLSSKAPSHDTLLQAMSDIFVENQGIKSIVQGLKRQQKKLLLLSNTNETHFQYIQSNFSLIKLFDHAVLSYEVKSPKPEREIYEAALKMADVEPHECLYIDDIPTHVEAAKKLGIDAILFTNVDNLRHDLAIRMVFV